MLPQPSESQADQRDSDDTKQMLDPETLRDWRRSDMNFFAWRWDSAMDEEYYDGNQYDVETMQALRDRGLPMITTNCIAQQINDVVGLQESSMTDWVLRAEGLDADDMVDAL